MDKDTFEKLLRKVEQVKRENPLLFWDEAITDAMNKCGNIPDDNTDTRAGYRYAVIRKLGIAKEVEEERRLFKERQAEKLTPEAKETELSHHDKLCEDIIEGRVSSGDLKSMENKRSELKRCYGGKTPEQLGIKIGPPR